MADSASGVKSIPRKSYNFLTSPSGSKDIRKKIIMKYIHATHLRVATSRDVAIFYQQEERYAAIKGTFAILHISDNRHNRP